MSTPGSRWFVFGAAVVGIVSAAGMFLIEHLRQEKRRHAMSQDLSRMDQQLSMMRLELDQLTLLQKEKANSSLRKIRSKSSNSSLLDADSSDLEFYDLSEDETVTPLDLRLTRLDHQLTEGTLEVVKESLEDLKDLCIEYPENSELLWRIGKAHHRIASNSNDRFLIQENVSKGLEACSLALRLEPNSAEGHKWFAILIGSRSDHQPLKERIQDGHVFKEHIDEAIRLNPSDASLHHMLGRFAFEVAGLKWYERKAAAAFFAEPPIATFQDALEHFLEAQELTRNVWKENKLMVAKCYIAMGDFKSAVGWLEATERVKNAGDMDDKVNLEIKSLLMQYRS